MPCPAVADLISLLQEHLPGIFLGDLDWGGLTILYKLRHRVMTCTALNEDVASPNLLRGGLTLPDVLANNIDQRLGTPISPADRRRASSFPRGGRGLTSPDSPRRRVKTNFSNSTRN